MRQLNRAIGLAAVVAMTLTPLSARAGGFDIPDVGTEALGRGGAFVAKADSPLALYYNIAGLAQQRGTRLLIDSHIAFYDQAFTRFGNYPGDPKDPSTPWAGKPYPTVHDKGGPGPIPFLGVTTDFGYFEKWTFGMGIYAPPGLGVHQYGTRNDVTVYDPKDATKTYTTPRYEVDAPASPNASWTGANNRAPSPARYDIAETNLLILMPTFAAAYRVNKYLDVGAAFQVVYAKFDLMNANLNPLGSDLCHSTPEYPVRDYPDCDSYGNIFTETTTYSGVLSVLAHPADWIDVGLTYRPQINLDSTGHIHPYVTIQSPLPVPDFPVSFKTKLPNILRGGVRAVSRYPDGTERADLELDATWEQWSVEKAAIINSDQFPLGNGVLHIEVPHNYRDTFSVRLGGAYNHRLSDTRRLIFRMGTYFDSAATKTDDNHLDAITAAKYGFTLGLGYKFPGMTINLAYAAIFVPDRTVNNSSVTAISAINGTNYLPSDNPTIPVGNGLYQTSLQMLSLGLTFNFAEFGRSSLYTR